MTERTPTDVRESRTTVRTTVTVVDVSQLVVALGLLGIYGASHLTGRPIPEALNYAVITIVTVIVAKRVPTGA